MDYAKKVRERNVYVCIEYYWRIFRRRIIHKLLLEDDEKKKFWNLIKTYSYKQSAYVNIDFDNIIWLALC